MVGLYDDPFAYDGSDFTFLAQDHYAGSGSSPEDFHVTSATDTHFPSAVQPLKQHQHQYEQQQLPRYLSPTLETAPALLPPAPTSFPSSVPHTTNNNNFSLNTDNNPLTTLAWPSNPTPPQNQPQQPPPTGDNPLATARALIASLQSELRTAAHERDTARMQLSTARNELYAMRQVEKRLRTERDEARQQAEFLGQERVKARVVEGRLRRERNELRGRLVAAGGLAGGNGGGIGGGRVGSLKKRRPGGVEVLLGRGGDVGGESMGEESESPPQGAEVG